MSMRLLSPAMTSIAFYLFSPNMKRDEEDDATEFGRETPSAKSETSAGVKEASQQHHPRRANDDDLQR